jgi:hypothetical protein
MSVGNAKLFLWSKLLLVPSRSDNLIVSPSTFVFKVPVNLNCAQSDNVVLADIPNSLAITPDSFSNLILELPVSVWPSSNIPLLWAYLVKGALKFLCLGPAYAKPLLTSTFLTL